MMPRNLTLYRFTAAVAPLLGETLEANLRAAAARECGPLELRTRGFGPALNGEQFTARIGRFVVLRLLGDDKILPSATVNRELAQRVQRIAEQEGRNVGVRERRRLKDEVLTDLLPQALCKPYGVLAFLDVVNGWLAIGTASRRAAEEFVSQLREALGTFPARPACPEESPRAAFAAWMLGAAALPKGLALGDECRLRQPSEVAQAWRGTGIDLTSEEVRAQLHAGFMPERLGLTLAGRVHFTLDEAMVLRKVRLGDEVLESWAQEEHQSRDALQASEAALYCLEIGQVLRALDDVFGLPRPDAQGAA